MILKANRTPTHVACQYYAWKPMLALFRSVELEVYQRVGVSLPSPTLDLGCGEGRPMQMLRDLCLAEEATVGFDLSRDALKEGQSLGAHRNYVQGDALHLPFANASFASIVSNNVFSSMPNFSVEALEELRRVLRPEGLAVVTVATDRFLDMLPVPRLLDRISHRLANRYVRNANERLPHFHTFSSDEWRHLFVQAGLEVVRVEPYFSSRVGALWNILFLRVFRVFGLLRLVRLAELLFAPILERVLERPVSRERNLVSTADRDFGYALVLARYSGGRNE